METNYYNILNISKNATLEQIKSAYKKKALLYHPDKNINKEDKIYYEQKFRELSEAYQILSNSETRKKYDENNMKWSFENETEFENPFELFEKFFNDIPNEYIYFTTKIIHKLTKLETTFLSNIINEIPDENKLKPAIKNINKIIENKYNLYKKNKSYMTSNDTNIKNKNETKNETKHEDIIFENMKNKNSNTNIHIYLKKEDLNITTTIYISLEEVYNNEIKKIDITRLIIKDKEKIKDKKTFIFSVNQEKIIYYNEGDQYYNNYEEKFIYGDIIIHIEYKKDDVFKNYKIMDDYNLLYEKKISLFEFIYGTEFELLFFNNEILKIKKEENEINIYNEDEYIKNKYKYDNRKEFQIIIGKGLPYNNTNNLCLKYGNLYIKYKINLDNLNYTLLKNEEIKEILIKLFPSI